jgi:hypothetical protein
MRGKKESSAGATQVCNLGEGFVAAHQKERGRQACRHAALILLGEWSKSIFGVFQEPGIR